MRYQRFNYRVNGAAPKTNRFGRSGEEESYEDVTKDFYGNVQRAKHRQRPSIAHYTETDNFPISRDVCSLDAKAILPETTKPITTSVEFTCDDGWIEDTEEIEEETDEEDGGEMVD